MGRQRTPFSWAEFMAEEPVKSKVRSRVPVRVGVHLGAGSGDGSGRRGALGQKTQGEDDMTVDTVQPQATSVISRTGAMAGSNNALRSGATRQVGRAAERKKQKPS